MNDQTPDDQQKVSRPARWRKRGGRMFWLWIGYQSVKGMITLSLIWIPLLLVWLNRSGG